MRNILRLALKSLWNRKATAAVTVVSISLSVALLFGVEKLRTEAKNSFTNTISGTDLIVGARGGAMQLLLYSVFRMGYATNNISWKSYQDVAEMEQVQWTVPISLGDSHKGYRVMGTTADYFHHYSYGRGQHLELAQGEQFQDLYNAVLGAEVARILGYQVGDSIILSHGAGKESLLQHDDKPFRISGILAPTGTPVDRTIHVSLEAIEAIHVDWKAGVPNPAFRLSADQVRRFKLQPKQITAFLVKLKSPITIFQVQRAVNQYDEEPLTAILPGVVLQQLWSLTSVVENVLLAVSGFVVLVGLSGMLTALLTSVNERRREMAVLRSLGARPVQIFALIVGETAVITLVGLIVGLIILNLMVIVLGPYALSHYGMSIEVAFPSSYEFALMGLVFLAGVLVGVVPAWRIYRNSLVDGMTVRM
jgi:putative ABC transport system permease protein